MTSLMVSEIETCSLILLGNGIATTQRHWDVETMLINLNKLMVCVCVCVCVRACVRARVCVYVCLLCEWACVLLTEPSIASSRKTC